MVVYKSNAARMLYYYIKDYAQARAKLEELIVMLRRTVSPDAVKLAGVYYHTHRYADCLALLETNLAIKTFATAERKN
jgi:hypothetical protein